MLFMQLEDRSAIIISLQRPAFFLDSRSDAIDFLSFDNQLERKKSLFSKNNIIFARK